MHRAILLVLGSLGAGVRGSSCPEYGDGWSTVSLDPTISFRAHHKVVGGFVHLRLEAESLGWLGFGLAEGTTGHMKGADLVTAAVVDGQVRVEDRHATFAPTTYSMPSAQNGYFGLTAVEDVHHDWAVVSGNEDGGVTSVWLTRVLDTGDSQDRAIAAGRTRIVWAWGATDDVRPRPCNL